MKILGMLFVSMLLLQPFALAKKDSARQPSSEQCVKSPTILCKRGFEINQDSKGCFHCVAREEESENEGKADDADDESSEDAAETCVKSPVLHCKKGFEIARTAKGCFVCVKR